MLVLSRKLGERILVPHCDLTVTVVAIEGNTVRLGISAPGEIRVYREELWRQICARRRHPIPCQRGPRRNESSIMGPAPFHLTMHPRVERFHECAPTDLTASPLRRKATTVGTAMTCAASTRSDDGRRPR